MVEDKGLSKLLMGIIYDEAHDSHDYHDGNDGHDDQDDPRMSHHLFMNHIDDAPGLFCLNAKGICRP